MNLSNMPLCWICNSKPANSGEHIIQDRDIKRSFSIKPGDPLFIRTSTIKNLKVQSCRSNRLKFSKVICENCNTTLTQPHDLDWQKLSEFLNDNSFSAGKKLRFNRVFPYNTRRSMYNVQLHFVKKLGCAIVEDNIPIDISSFSEALLENKCHPNVYIGFTDRLLEEGKNYIEISDIQYWHSNDVVSCMIWSFSFEKFTVVMMYAAEGESRTGQSILWNPRSNPNCISIFDVNDLINKDKDKEDIIIRH